MGLPAAAGLPSPRVGSPPHVTSTTKQALPRTRPLKYPSPPPLYILHGGHWHYKSRFLVDQSEVPFVPFAIETGGRWDRAARKFASSFIISCIGKESVDFSADEKLLYSRTLRCLLDSIDSARARHIARQFLGRPDSAPSSRSNTPPPPA